MHPFIFITSHFQGDFRKKKHTRQTARRDRRPCAWCHFMNDINDTNHINDMNDLDDMNDMTDMNEVTDMNGIFVCISYIFKI